MPLQNMEDNKNSSSKTTDIASSDKETENKISVTRSKNWSTPVQTNQRLLRPQQPLQRPQGPRRPQVVQAEIIPTVPPVQNLNEHVNDTGFDPVEASQDIVDPRNTKSSSSTAIKRYNRNPNISMLNVTESDRQYLESIGMSQILAQSKDSSLESTTPSEITDTETSGHHVNNTDRLKRSRFSSSSSYDSYDSSSIDPGSHIAENTSIKRKNGLGAISTTESETMNNEAFIELPREVSTSSEAPTDYEKQLKDMVSLYCGNFYKSKNGTYHVKTPQGETRALYGYVENKDNTISFFKITDAELFFTQGCNKNGIVLKKTKGLTKTKKMKRTDIIHRQIEGTLYDSRYQVKYFLSNYKNAKLIPQPGTEKASKSTMAEIKPVDGSVNVYATNAELTPTSPQDEPETRRGCFNFFKRRNRGGRS